MASWEQSPVLALPPDWYWDHSVQAAVHRLAVQPIPTPSSDLVISLNSPVDVATNHHKVMSSACSSAHFITPN